MEVIQILGEFIILLIRTPIIILEALFNLLLPPTEKPVKEEIVLITGAGHGIGKELALQYALQGATVVCWDINKETNNETVKEIAEMECTKAYGYVCNVANREEVNKVAKRVQKEVGDVTILVNNAGLGPTREFLELTPEAIEAVVNVNVMAHFWILQAFLPIMLKNNRGHIVAISSCAGLVGTINSVPYCATKYAVRGMMDSLYQELHTNPENRIKLTTIYPLMVDTGMVKRPVIRFNWLTPMLKTEYVANCIISAQRRNVREAAIPRHFLFLTSVSRLFPEKLVNLFMNFLSYYLESDV